uniref:Uncharacterized protein n=1 Tax=Arundo donax TaxID=35708 RepID=A0A0A9EDJ7_ARUDO
MTYTCLHVQVPTWLHVEVKLQGQILHCFHCYKYRLLLYKQIHLQRRSHQVENEKKKILYIDNVAGFYCKNNLTSVIFSSPSHGWQGHCKNVGIHSGSRSLIQDSCPSRY